MAAAAGGGGAHGDGQTSYDFLFKLVVIGDSSVGKTALSVRFCNNTFRTSYMATIGLDLTKRVVDVDGAKVKLHIWDTAGQERFRTITAAYYREAHGVVFVYDVTNPTSFANIKRWLVDVNEHTQGSKITKVIVGNKIDLAADRRVETSAGKTLAAGLDVPFFEASAATGQNVDAVFLTITRDILKRIKEDAEKAVDAPEQDVPLNIAESAAAPPARTCCFT